MLFVAPSFSKVYPSKHDIFLNEEIPPHIVCSLSQGTKGTQIQVSVAEHDVPTTLVSVFYECPSKPGPTKRLGSFEFTPYFSPFKVLQSHID